MSDDKDYQSTFKVVLVGNSGVGKSSIITKYIDNQFSENYFSNVTTGIFYKDITMNDGETIKLHIWDSSGQERYRVMNKLELQDSQCVIFVYDISNLQSFQSIPEYWYEEVKKTVQENTLFYVVGNKSDLCDLQDVDETLRDEFLKEKGLKFKEVSARTGHNIKELFEDIAKLLQQIQKENFLFPIFNNLNNSKLNSELLSRRSAQKQRKASCC